MNNGKAYGYDAELKEALRELAEILLAKYPDTVRAIITLEGGLAELDIQQKLEARYIGGE